MKKRRKTLAQRKKFKIQTKTISTGNKINAENEVGVICARTYCELCTENINWMPFVHSVLKANKK